MFSKNIKQIVSKSKEMGTDSNKLISMMNEHTAEIKDLFDRKDKHFAVETGDLIMLAMQLLMTEGYNVDDILGKCYTRFKRKFGVI